MTTTTSRESDSSYPAGQVPWGDHDLRPAPRRAPTRGTEAIGAAFRAQVALRAPGVVMIPSPATGANDEPSDLSDAPAPGTQETPDAQTSGIRDVAAVKIGRAHV